MSISLGTFRRVWDSLGISNLGVKKLAVAFSGGPDSLALLFLLQRHIRLVSSPISLTSITINHHLQAASDSMTEQCKALSHSLGVENISVSIPWSQPPFPPLPAPGLASEEIARRARAHLIFDLMQDRGCNALVMGHHADDQVETLLMRMALHQNSSRERRLGFSGMRPARRWGMGYGIRPGDLGWAGVSGMNTWILRPLLGVPKESLIATCREEGLTFVQDSTNFDPSLTRRNAFRAALATQSLTSLDQRERDLTFRTIGRAETMAAPHPRFDGERLIGNPLLRSWVHQLGQEASSRDRQVSKLLEDHILPTPPSTLVLRNIHIQSDVESDVLKRALVLRILRYISPQPWGSPLAEASRQSRSIEGIMAHLFPAGSAAANPASSPVSFTMGSGVLWRRGVLQGPSTESKTVRRLTKDWRPNASDEPCWIVHRAPPRSYRERGNVEVDITSIVMANLEEPLADERTNHELLWDCRFTMTLSPWLLPEEHKRILRAGRYRILLRAVEPFQLPEVVATDGTVTTKIGGYKKGWNAETESLDTHWAKFNFIRLLTAN